MVTIKNDLAERKPLKVELGDTLYYEDNLYLVTRLINGTYTLVDVGTGVNRFNLHSTIEDLLEATGFDSADLVDCDITLRRV